MKITALRCRLLAGITVLGLAALLLPGCSEQAQSIAGTDISLVATVADPNAPTSDDITQAAVKPDNPADAVATMSAPVLSTDDGTAISSTGTASSLQITYGENTAPNGSLPLQQQNGNVTSNQFAVLPLGNSTISLSPGTQIDVGDVSVTHPMRLSDFNVKFSVRGGRPPAWTLPSTHRLRMQRHRRMYVLKGSYLELGWNGHHSVAPLDNKVTISVDLYDGTTKVAGPLIKTVTIVDNKAVFTSSTNVEFDRVAISIDLRDAK